jgi:hypothetical protein
MNRLTTSYGIQTKGEFGTSEGTFSAYPHKHLENVIYASASMLVTTNDIYIIDDANRIKVNSSISISRVLANGFIVDKSNNYYEVDLFSKTLYLVSIQSTSPISIKDIYMNFLLTTNNEIYSWEPNTHAIGPMRFNTTFFKSKIVTISESRNHRAVLLDDGRVFCWGDNSSM